MGYRKSTGLSYQESKCSIARQRAFFFTNVIKSVVDLWQVVLACIAVNELMERQSFAYNNWMILLAIAAGLLSLIVGINGGIISDIERRSSLRNMESSVTPFQKYQAFVTKVRLLVVVAILGAVAFLFRHVDGNTEWIDRVYTYGGEAYVQRVLKGILISLSSTGLGFALFFSIDNFAASQQRR